MAGHWRSRLDRPEIRRLAVLLTVPLRDRLLTLLQAVQLVQARDEREGDPREPEARGALLDGRDRRRRERPDFGRVELLRDRSVSQHRARLSAPKLDRPTHPDEGVVHEVAGVAELATDGGDLEDRIREVDPLDGRLQVLERLADAHHCVRPGRGISSPCSWPCESRGKRAASESSRMATPNLTAYTEYLRLRERARVLLSAWRRATVSFE